MNLKPHGYRIVDIPVASDALLASFDDLPLDEYCGGPQRFHRFSQYQLRFYDGNWHTELLPHRPLLQSDVYNSKSGNVMREIAPVVADAAPWIDATLQSCGLDTKRDWHLDINQYRVITTPEIEGISVPEGVHQDGHHYVMILVFRRHEITGSVLRLLPVGGGAPFFEKVIEAGQAIVLDDRQMLHDASPIEPIGEYGYRDYFGTALNPWEERRYGEEFESKVLAAVRSSRGV